MSAKSAKKSASASVASSTSSGQSPQSSSSMTTTTFGSSATMMATSTPVASSNPASSDRRPGSPLSPARHTLLQDKQDLQVLNNRLACYIDRVRHLEAENLRLTREAQTTQETVTREVTSIKSMYEHELCEARKLLDDTARERAKLEIDTKRLWDDNEDLKNKLAKKLKDLEVTERNLLLYESKCNDMQLQLKHSQAECKRLSDREKELEEEVNKLQGLFDDTRKHLEQETLQRIDLENNIQSLKEDISFKHQIYQQELTETRTRRQVEISEIDGQLAEQYEAKLERSLQEIRESYEAQIRANREEIELLYENKLKNLSSQAQRNSGAASLAVEELRQMKSKNEAFVQSVRELEAANDLLNSQVRDLKNLRDADRRQFEARLAVLEAELARVREEGAQQLREYQDLVDIKTALDLEITAYRKLLDTEEARLNITHSREGTSGPSTRSSASKQTPLRQGKRKRTMLEESEERSSTDYSVTGTARGNVEITEGDPQGRFIKLTNKGNKEIGIGAWQLIRKAGDLETVFKFHRTTKIEAGGTVTVWSADTNTTHDPPSNIVMKGQKWSVGDSVTTKLLNNEGEEVAASERKKHQLSSRVSHHRDFNLGGFRPAEELHHQQLYDVASNRGGANVEIEYDVFTGITKRETNKHNRIY